jgi:xanthine dehydrogenase large subunit
MIFQKETHSPLEVLATGEAKFAGEFMPGMNPYYAYPVVSTVAHGKILSIDPKEALAQEDVIGFYTASDIPGKNSIGAVQRNEEPLLAFDEVNYVGQPVGFVLAKTRLAAIKAADSVVVKIEELPSILSYDEAIAVKSYYSTPLVIESGDLKKGFEDAHHIVEGVFETDLLLFLEIIILELNFTVRLKVSLTFKRSSPYSLLSQIMMLKLMSFV